MSDTPTLQRIMRAHSPDLGDAFDRLTHGELMQSFADAYPAVYYWSRGVWHASIELPSRCASGSVAIEYVHASFSFCAAECRRLAAVYLARRIEA